MSKAYAVIRRFEDGSIEGVIFSNKSDAETSLTGNLEPSYSTLAGEFVEIYGDEINCLEMIEIEI